MANYSEPLICRNLGRVARKRNVKAGFCAVTNSSGPQRSRPLIRQEIRRFDSIGKFRLRFNNPASKIF